MIDMVIDDEGWMESLPDAEKLAGECASAALRAEPGLEGEIALLLTSDAAMADLNSRFRGKEGPTNVLSFPSGDDGEFLGDIALARETCLSEAAEKGISIRDHAAHLIIHGMLHLIGYDHQRDEEANAMEQRETAILTSMGVADPYADALETKR